MQPPLSNLLHSCLQARPAGHSWLPGLRLCGLHVRPVPGTSAAACVWVAAKTSWQVCHTRVAAPRPLPLAYHACRYIAVRLLPLSDAVSLAFLAPLLVAALSPLLLHERPPRSVLVALFLAAVGALLVAWPASLAALLRGASSSPAGAGAVAGPSKAGVAAALAHAASAAGARLAVRSLGIHSTHHSVTGAIVLAAGAVSALGSGAVVATQRSWVAPVSLAQWALLASVGLVGYLHQVRPVPVPAVLCLRNEAACREV